MQEVNDRRGRGWAWATLFVVLGGIYVMDGLRGGGEFAGGALWRPFPLVDAVGDAG